MIDPIDREILVTKTMKIGAMMALAMTLLSAVSQAQPSQSKPSPPVSSPINPNGCVTRVVVGDAVDALDAAQPALFISKVPPDYPLEEVREGITGKVLLQITMSADGDQIDIKIERSSHSRHLDGAAVDAAKKWKFKPAHGNGKAAQSVVRVPVDFQLTDRCSMRDDSDIAVPVGKR